LYYFHHSFPMIKKNKGKGGPQRGRDAPWNNFKEEII
jgi:hypothetical protein